MSQPIISVENLSKAYRVGAKEEVADTLMGALTNSVRYPFRNLRRLRDATTIRAGDKGDDVLWALRDVSFQVNEGEVVGVIGRNGAGKSTLLKILSRITDPTGGRAVIRGRVSSLLEVGTGFHPELTGRENIYMNGTILGMTKREIDRKFDEIVDFSGVEKFLDTATKHYSSGMQVRLAFAVAAHLEPEILIIDEVLAVGDAAFQKKCMDKMRDVSLSGQVVLFVSHNLGAVQHLCRSGVVLSGGRIIQYGTAEEAIATYVTSINKASESLELRQDREGVGATTISSVTVTNSSGGSFIRSGDSILFTLTLSHQLAGLRCVIVATDHMGRPIAAFRSRPEIKGDTIHARQPLSVIECFVDALNLLPGRYLINAEIWSGNDCQDSVENVGVMDVEAGPIGGRFFEATIRNACVSFPAKWTMS